MLVDDLMCGEGLFVVDKVVLEGFCVYIVDDRRIIYMGIDFFDENGVFYDFISY